MEKKKGYLSVLGNCYYGDNVDEDGNDSLYAPERSVDAFKKFVFVMCQQRVGLLCQRY